MEEYNIVGWEDMQNQGTGRHTSKHCVSGMDSIVKVTCSNNKLLSMMTMQVEIDHAHTTGRQKWQSDRIGKADILNRSA